MNVVGRFAQVLMALVVLAGVSLEGHAQLDVSNNTVCLGCHDNPAFAVPRPDGTDRSLHVDSAKFAASVHGKMQFTCVTCHSQITQLPHKKPTMTRAEWRRSIPDLCGNCHAKERAAYEKSVHGDEVIWKNNSRAAVCSDCHRPHEVQRPKTDAAKLHITENCGNCHADKFSSYIHTYHGQINRLGYAHTAKCFNCHGSHSIQRTHDPESMVHPDNRLKTCQQCHVKATAGFVTFEPHATTTDFGRYPYVWITYKFMIGLLVGTFAFFWTHTALWFYREYKERKERKNRKVVRTEELVGEKRGFYRRWPWGWRLAHLLFAMCLMTLTLTGMSLLFPTSPWAPTVIRALGGPELAGLIHRTAAVTFATIFFGHLVYVAIYLARNISTFDWFGPYSMVPSLQDIKDIFAMFRWFFGQAPRPDFDRWTYWEKFDYWAPFWGVTIIGSSGVMLWFPEFTASFLPGWVFNVATILHGEEAVLAVGFLFTVHFFNNHFRPDKFPLDIVMFTGAMPLEEFRRDHAVEYKRLVKTGQLDKYLIDAPSQPMTVGSTVLGFTLIAVGLTLLVLVFIGLFGSLSAA